MNSAHWRFVECGSNFWRLRAIKLLHNADYEHIFSSWTILNLKRASLTGRKALRFAARLPSKPGLSKPLFWDSTRLKARGVPAIPARALRSGLTLRSCRDHRPFCDWLRGLGKAARGEAILSATRKICAASCGST